MNAEGKLQKAVGLMIAAGYQFNADAFEFLSMMSATEDPIEIVGKAVKRLEYLHDKPLLIERSFLTQLLEERRPTKEIIAQSSEELSLQLPELKEGEGKGSFHPYAKEVDAEITIIDDPSTKLGSNGTVEDFLGYFRDRFKRMEKLLRQRVDVKSASSVTDALKAQANTRFKIIGMLTEKRESKKRVVLTIEDLQANITVLVPQNAPEELQRKARMLLLDQVICLSAVKTRSTLLIAEDIILPEVGQRNPHKASIPIYAVLTSDMHVGSAEFQKDAFNRFILWLNGKYGNERMRELAGRVKYVLIAGDVVDGVGIYPNQVRELTVRDVNKQYRLAARYIDQIPDYIEVLVAPGNHDAPRKALPQPAIKSTFLETLQESKRVHSLGNPCYISLHGVEVLMYHGRSLDDVIATTPEMSPNNPEKAMRLLLQSRHLAPIYGGRTALSPESRDFLVIDRVPDILHAGHIHALGYTNYRGVLIVNSGGWQGRTEYMKRLGFTPTPGEVPVVNLQTLEVTVVPFN